METVDEAMANFKELGFSAEHKPRVAPISDNDEIARIERDLPKTSLKERAFLECELELQTKGEKEMVRGYKFFNKFRDFHFLPNGKWPYISGSFDPENSRYDLIFVARIPEVIDNPKNHNIFCGLTFDLENVVSKEDRRSYKKLFKDIVSMTRNFYGMGEDIKIFGGDRLKILLPPFNLEVESENLFKAYEELTDAMDKVGYVQGE